MKKLFMLLLCCATAAGVSFAETEQSNVYIAANISQSFENFSYDSFIDHFLDKKAEDGKILDGPRYDFCAGYRLGSKIRIEGQYIIISKHSFQVDKETSDIEYKATAVFANILYDFWDVQKSIITPFLGIGIGVGSPNLKLSIRDLQEESKENGFSWQAQGGINLRLTKWLIVNVKYSYLAMPEVTKNIDSSHLNNGEYLESKFKEGVQAIGAGITLML
ncbi:MAG: porin family protein [Endomicrobium sp.]|jgi:opacity protein-like surface antigen|nr:porin family protein [Endomicrobium sp.]